MDIIWRIVYVIHAFAALSLFCFGMVAGIVAIEWYNVPQKERTIFKFGLFGPLAWGLMWLVIWVITGHPPIKM